ncbi:twin-arginine translocase subunit TatC [Fodinisporobacter ferrooxydans]|uniref:Sec-independent protein translocase protein TatC n=1 Tax=Fodinisporobacter ferrooxydans TaxID=2901836 RepID=A0ABY4CS12_9BACL|nr:twin-arginine translocase subunit TatC [Alicyclobacillaceae bacterium MYW30-H2]
MSDSEMGLVQHLEDLRKRLILTLVFFVLALIVSFLFIGKIYGFLIQPLLGAQLTVLGPAESIRVYFTLAGVFALGLTLPYALYHVWRFVSPALTEKEKKITFRYIPAVFLMFVAGIVFGYFVVFHMLLRVLLQISRENFSVMLTAGNYFGFLIDITLPFGFLFEMPIVVMFLTKIGIVNPIRLAKMRKYAYFILVIVASMLSPPELVSHLSVAAPMILLYEISIWISRIVYRKQLLMQQSYEEHYSSEEA